MQLRESLPAPPRHLARRLFGAKKLKLEPSGLIECDFIRIAKEQISGDQSGAIFRYAALR